MTSAAVPVGMAPPPAPPPSSSSSALPASQRDKLTTLRRRLDQLGFRQPLGVDSLPLVERLFADLLHTTESLRTAKLRRAGADRAGGGGGGGGGVAEAVEPYRSDNAKLVKENNELHQQLIRQREQHDATLKGQSAAAAAERGGMVPS